MNARPLNPRRREDRILEGLSTAVLVFDGELRLDYLNPAAEMLLAVSARQAEGHRLGDVIPGAGELAQRLDLALRGEQPFTERELHLHTPAGQEIIVDCAVTPLIDPQGGSLSGSLSGSPSGSWGRPQILVELVQVDRHLRIAREESLLEQHHAARQLVRGLAHEIKNPLGGLRGAAQLLERELEDEDLKEYTRIIIGEADRLRSLVNRMLGPNQLPQRRRCNIHQVVEHVRNLVEAEGNPGLVLVRDYDPSIPDFQADPEQLIQAVLNIVRNAVQALAGEGRIVLRTRTQRQVTIGPRRHKLVVRVDIIDDGPGVPPELQETLFYPMVTGHADGAGLGLSIAQSLVNRHGGIIECSSRPGHTEFTILLPLEPVDDEGR
ncbi:MAG: nitrogen regulation protein NR(II) [Pseudomonadota bacterium]